MCWCMKGIEADTGKRLTEIVKEYTDTPTAIWVGPGHVQDFTRGIPNCMVIDSDDKALKERLVQAFSSRLIRFITAMICWAMKLALLPKMS